MDETRCRVNAAICYGVEVRGKKTDRRPGATEAARIVPTKVTGSEAPRPRASLVPGLCRRPRAGEGRTQVGAQRRFDPA